VYAIETGQRNNTPSLCDFAPLQTEKHTYIHTEKRRRAYVMSRVHVRSLVEVERCSSLVSLIRVVHNAIHHDLRVTKFFAYRVKAM